MNIFEVTERFVLVVAADQPIERGGCCLVYARLFLSLHYARGREGRGGELFPLIAIGFTLERSAQLMSPPALGLYVGRRLASRGGWVWGILGFGHTVSDRLEWAPMKVTVLDRLGRGS